jgi:hypothetical protein
VSRYLFLYMTTNICSSISSGVQSVCMAEGHYAACWSNLWAGGSGRRMGL